MIHEYACDGNEDDEWYVKVLKNDCANLSQFEPINLGFI
jgi:hypothetical protein